MNISEYLAKYEPPKHVALIMDGNGRWAKKRLFNRTKGHREGAESVDVVTETARRIGIKVLTLYAFSTENWSRPEKEVSFLMKLLEDYLKNKKDTLIKNDIRLNIIGQIERLPENVRNAAEDVMKATAKSSGMVLNLALSYGGRQEILKSVKEFVQKGINKEINPEDITEELFASSLYTKDMPEPELIIRTSGEQRLSNYLLWQSAYSELYFTDTYWPDFREEAFINALCDFSSRERRYGKTGEQIKGEEL